jgi:hypothetical protein
VSRFLVLLLVAAAALATAPSAGAKENVRATLTSRIPLDAPAGTRLEVSWLLRARDESGRWHPFSAGEIFVRLVGATGDGAETSFATPGPVTRGIHTASVVVPEGGIGDVQIGLRGYVSDFGGSRTRVSDMFFPITNDPLPGVARVSASDRGAGFDAWPVVLAALLSALVLALLIVRRAGAGRAAHQS